MAHHQSAGLVHQPNTTDDQNDDDIKSRFCILDVFYRTASNNPETRRGRLERLVARQSKPLVQRQSAIHPMVEQRSVGKLVSSPKPPEAGAQRARLYTSLTAGHHNSRMQLTLEDAHSRQ